MVSRSSWKLKNQYKRNKVKSLRIVLISDSYPPEVRSASRLMYEFSITMVEMGHAVTVLTTTPQYNLADNTETDFRTVEVEDGVKVVRIRTLPIHLVSMMWRGISVLSLPYSFVKAGKRFVDVYPQVILVYSPPLTLAIAGRLLAKQFNAKLVLNVQDLFPQNAIDLGLMSNLLLIKIFEAIEKYAYSVSDYVTVHSHGNLQMLTNVKGVNPRRIEVFHNWVDAQEYPDIGATRLGYRENYKLKGKFVVLFGGVMGPAQGLDVVIEAAEHLAGTPACFLLVGDGTEKVKLQKMADEKSLENVIFKPFVAAEEFDMVLACADAGLVSLSPEMKTPVVPGKLAGFMAKGIPVVACLNNESDGIGIIRAARCGFACEAGNGKALAQHIKNLMNSDDIAIEMGESGWRYVKEHMSRKAIVKQYEELFANLIIDH